MALRGVDNLVSLSASGELPLPPNLVAKYHGIDYKNTETEPTTNDERDRTFNFHDANKIHVKSPALLRHPKLQPTLPSFQLIIPTSLQEYTPIRVSPISDPNHPCPRACLAISIERKSIFPPLPTPPVRIHHHSVGRLEIFRYIDSNSPRLFVLEYLEIKAFSPPIFIHGLPISHITAVVR